ncbi:MAG TPA: NADH-quinone oxidoreductase subunit L [Candidatus Baltobacteraceae bacterium]|nr:NADH-quinone oxidoreductase subunit L [Candidatus Baltobacteraceae bacterium]
MAESNLPLLLIPLWPLLGFLAIGFFGRRMSRSAVATIACGSVALSLLTSLWAVASLLGMPEGSRRIEQIIAPWIGVGGFQADWGLLLDPLSSVMILVVSGVGFLIHVYSIGYMHHDRDFPRFFALLNLFTFSMLMLVLANNYLLLYVFWEAVGLCSYLLIGFWFERPSAAEAGKKAFIVNRVGDFGFGLGVMLLWTTLGTLRYGDVFSAAPGKLDAGGALVTVLTLLLFLGATGKSAQIPLFVWLPDAMEGPTPVSALIHAATRVTAGVYMVARSAPLFNLAPFSMEVVAWIGGLTAVFAATIALVQTDIKRVIAYSTISQLGYMFLGCGVGAYAAAIFHLMTHAFFKALLFLGAGSVIHGLDGEQDLTKMGGLRRQMPITAITFLIGALANAGIIPLAGFWSKDEILFGAFASGHVMLWVFGAGGACLTGFYMLRCYILAFEGQSRNPHAHAHESPAVMTVPLIILAVFAFGVGFVGFPPDGSVYHHLVEPVFAGAGEPAAHGLGLMVAMAAVSLIMAVLGIVVARVFYLRRPELAARLVARYPGVYRVLRDKYYVDELYQHVFVGPIYRASVWLWRRFDEPVVDGSVNGIGGLVRAGSTLMRYLQTGYVMNYVLSFLIGVVAIIGYLALAR